MTRLILPLLAALAAPLGAQSLVVPTDARLVPDFSAVLPAPALAVPTARAVASDRGPFIGRRDAAYAATLLGVGALLLQVDERIANAFPDSVDESRGWGYAARRVAPFNEFKAFYVSAGMYAVGRVAGKREFAGLGLHAAEAVAVSKVLMDVSGGLAGRSRPKTRAEPDAFDFSWGRGFREVGFRSFPSRHVSGVSALAAVAALETRAHWPGSSRWVTPVAVAAPLVVGLGRMYTGHHWSTDVLAGAALGTWVGWKTVRLTHDHPNNAIDRALLGKR